MIMFSPRVAIDTNIALRSVNREDPEFAAVVGRLDSLLKSGVELCIAPQIVYEFWVVATRPQAVNGLGLDAEAAAGHVDHLLTAFSFIPDPPDLTHQWVRLCRRYSVLGRTAHDARLAAWMIGHGIKQLVTLNAADFQRFPEIECLGT